MKPLMQLSLFCDNKGRSKTICRKRNYSISSIRRRKFSLYVSVRLPFDEGDVYFIGKSADINDRWIRFVQRYSQRRLLDAGSSTRNLSVLLSVMEELYNTNSPSASPVTVVRIIRMRVLRIVSAAPI